MTCISLTIFFYFLNRSKNKKPLIVFASEFCVLWFRFILSLLLLISNSIIRRVSKCTMSSQFVEMYCFFFVGRNSNSCVCVCAARKVQMKREKLEKSKNRANKVETRWQTSVNGKENKLEQRVKRKTNIVSRSSIDEMHAHLLTSSA